MTRRIYTYFPGEGWSAYNMISTVGAFILGGGVVVTIINVATSLRRGRVAGSDPWKGNTLEWFAQSPPPVNNFDVIPRVRSAEPMRDIRRRRGGQPLLGPRSGRPDEAHRVPPCPGRADRPAERAPVRVGPGGELVRRAVADRQPALGLPGPVGLRGIRRGVHDLAQAPHAAEHRDRGRGRGRPAAGGMGGHPGVGLLDGGVPVRDRLLLDPAPLLGPQPADEGRLPAGGRPDAARG